MIIIIYFVYFLITVYKTQLYEDDDDDYKSQTKQKLYFVKKKFPFISDVNGRRQRMFYCFHISQK